MDFMELLGEDEAILYAILTLTLTANVMNYIFK